LTKSSKLASELMAATGLVCLRVSTLPGHPGFGRVAIGGIADRDSKGERIWFRSRRDAERVLQATFSRCVVSKKTKAGITVALPPDQVADLVDNITFSLGIIRKSDRDVAATFDSVHRRIEGSIKSVGRAGTFETLRGVIEHPDLGMLTRR
jgi:hypothetical protein